LSERYVDELGGVRFRYPEDWRVEAVGRGEARVEGDGVQMIIRVVEERRETIDVAAEMVATASKRGIKLLREREYFSIEGEDWTVMTWEEEREIVRRGIATTEGKMMVVEGRIEKDKFGEWVLTVDEIIKNTRLISG
jgi:hypothetical protein